MANYTYANGRAYDWSQIIITLGFFNSPLVGTKSIKYGEAETIERNYGAGQRAVSYGRGNIEPTVELEVSFDDFRKIVDYAPQGRVQDIPLFAITVTYNTPGKVVSDVIKYCVISEAPVDWSQGDSESTVSLTIISPEIEFGQR